jgi:hypothetical protein
MQLLKTPEGKKVQVDPQADLRLYKAPHNPPHTGTRYLTGTNLYYHTAKSGAGYYYAWRWSMWAGTEDSYELLTEGEAQEFILQMAVQAGYTGDGVEQGNCCQLWGDDFFDEDA